MKKELKKFFKKIKFLKNKWGILKIIKFRKIDLLNNYIIIRSISVGLFNWKNLNEIIKNIKKIFKRKKNKIKFIINISLNWFIFKKLKGIWMGKGKGKVNFDGWFIRILVNIIIFKFKGIDFDEFLKRKKILFNIIFIICVIS